VTGPPRPRQIYEVDSNIAQSWAGQQNAADDYAHVADMFGNEIQNTAAAANASLSSHNNNRTAGLRRPDIVKRMTSNQNEDDETKRDLQGSSIKRATLSRDSSAAAARLKELHFPDMPKKPFLPEQEMNLLSDTMEQSTIDRHHHHQVRNGYNSGAGQLQIPPPPPQIGLSSISKPGALGSSYQSSTFDSLSNSLDLGDDSQSSLIAPPLASSSRVPRPPTLRLEGRLSTAEYLDIVNEPLGFDESEMRMKPIEPSQTEWLQQGQ